MPVAGCFRHPRESVGLACSGVHGSGSAVPELPGIQEVEGSTSLRNDSELLDAPSTTQVWDAVVLDEATARTLALFRCTQMVLYPR